MDDGRAGRALARAENGAEVGWLLVSLRVNRFMCAAVWGLPLVSRPQQRESCFSLSHSVTAQGMKSAYPEDLGVR